MSESLIDDRNKKTLEDKARQLKAQHGRVSTAFLQRKLRITERKARELAEGVGKER